jgi:oxalate---CoA ligase
MTSHQTIESLVASYAATQPDAAAIESLNGPPLSYSGLLAQMERTRHALRQFGIGPADRVTIVLPDGPEAAVAFLSIAAAAVAAPLNPALRATRLRFYLQDIPARAVVVPASGGGDVAEVARALGIQILEVVSRPEGDGTFELRSNHAAQAVAIGPEATPNSLALVLHTSGSTSQPKLVPLTHANLSAAAHFTAEALELTAEDRALHVVPMFHIQGLVTSLLAPLAAGGTVICTPGLQAADFLSWLRTSRATWYTAVPTMHQAIVERARQFGPNRIVSRLRFVRSSASVLSAQLFAEIEEVFGVPVVDGYGMTETAPIIASNPLPPHPRKRGSVGVAAGPEVAILDEQGHPLGANAIGEICVRGANVTSGYERDPEATAAAFINGWFRTGDQGYRDADGFIFLTGRLKEIINRGGEKIAPLEIEEILLQHPAVGQAVVFAVPDSRLGEAVAAAVVLRPGTHVSETRLRGFVAGRLAFFKIPVRIVFLGQLPKGSTGKIQRIGLSALLDLPAENLAEACMEADRPTTAVEIELARLWLDVLHLKEVGIHDNFFVLGGSSILVVDLLARIRDSFGIALPEQTFFPQPTIAGLVLQIESRKPSVGTTAAEAPPPAVRRVEADQLARMVVPLQPSGTGTPLFVIHPGGDGSVSLYADLAGRLGTERPVLGVQAEGDWRGRERPYYPYTRLEDLAARYVQAVRAVHPRGPYHLAGASFGGTVAFEMARQLMAQGDQIGCLVLFSTHIRNNRLAPHPSLVSKTDRGLTLRKVKHRAIYPTLRAIAARWPAMYRAILSPQELRYQWLRRLGRRIPATLVSERFYRESRLFTSQYRPDVFDGPAVLFRALDDEDPRSLWAGLTRGLQVHNMPGQHLDMMSGPTVGVVADLVREYLRHSERLEPVTAMAS